MKNKQEQIDEVLMLKILENRANDTEKEVFYHWLNRSVMHVELFEQFKKAAQISFVNAASSQRNWNAIVSKATAGEKLPEYIELSGNAQLFGGFKKLQMTVKIAAMFILLAGVTFLFKIIVFDSEQHTVYGNDMNPRDPYHLADGSLVYLNKNSVIRFSDDFGIGNRQITLEGEAYFEVKRNEEKAFIITTGTTTTQVLGTKFTVNSDCSGNVEVIVSSGLVQFCDLKNRHKVLLTAGEKGLYNSTKQTITEEANKKQNFLAWKTGVLYFTNTPLSEALVVLQKHYSRIFVFEAKRNQMPTLTTTLDNMPLDAVLEELNLLLNTKNETRNDTIYFKPKI